MRERLVSFGDDFVIETGAGVPAFKVDGKALRVRNTIQIQDRAGRPLYRVQERVLRLKDTMVIERDGRTVATIQKALVTPLRDRFTVQVTGGPPLQVQGNIVDHEYTITRNGRVVATVSKRWFRVRDTYGVEVMAGEDHAFLLAVAAAIDTM
ncbi:LURP-one-related/scramblase family protein [Halobacteriaceae archaeon GCM10025711]